MNHYDHLDTDELEELKLSTMNEMQRYDALIKELDSEYTVIWQELIKRRIHETRAAIREAADREGVDA